jgi:arylsulfatase A-like enzyme
MSRPMAARSFAGSALARSSAVILLALLPVLLGGCSRSSSGRPPAATIHLTDLQATRRAATPEASRPVAESVWRFAEPPPDGGGATHGWVAGPGVERLRIADSRLAGRAGTPSPMLVVERSAASLHEPDMLTAVEVRLRTSAGERAGVMLDESEKLDLQELAGRPAGAVWRTTAPLHPGSAFETVTLRPSRPEPFSRLRRIVLRPTDAAGAAFEVESIKLVSRREQLAAIRSGPSWQGLGDVYRETLVMRAPDAVPLELALPRRAWLDVALGTVEESPVVFRVAVRSTAALAPHAATTVLERTISTPNRWEPVAVDLAAFAGRRVTLVLSLAAGRPGALGFWGSPAVRSHGTLPAAIHAARAAAADPPQGVIVIWSDTTRADHLSAYGYRRDTAPVLRRLAAAGTLFQHCIAQATWTKVATPSLLTSLYPTTHRVADFSDRLPASATTLAEVFRAGGYATLSYSSILFTGQFTNLHKGFEELHEDTSLPDQDSSKTARVYLDRLLPWLDVHRDTPFFVFLHVSDAHDPYEPYAPYDALWSDRPRKAEHERQTKAVLKFIADPLLKQFAMPARTDLRQAGIDAAAYSAFNQGWYDGSIRGMDVEIGRLVERLRELGLERKTLLVYTGDHGEEFFEHGRSFHGQSVYGELTSVPLIFYRPGHVPAGRVIGEPVETIDIMPTLLAATGLPVPPAAQGQSLLPLLAGTPGWRARPAISEKAVTHELFAPPPHDTESFAVVAGAWKLVHNTVRPRGGPEFELYDTRSDPLDQLDLAPRHPEVVGRLARLLDAWHAKAVAARLTPDAAATRSLSPEEVQRLRSLGYIQ